MFTYSFSYISDAAMVLLLGDNKVHSCTIRESVMADLDNVQVITNHIHIHIIQSHHGLDILNFSARVM